MSARPSKVPNWGRGGRGRFLKEGGGFGDLVRTRAGRAKEETEGSRDPRCEGEDASRGEHTRGVDAKGTTDMRTRISWVSWWYILGLLYRARESMYTVSESD